MPHNLVYQLIPNQHSTDFALGSYLGLHHFSCTCTMVWLGVWAYISIQSNCLHSDVIQEFSFLSKRKIVITTAIRSRSVTPTEAGLAGQQLAVAARGQRCSSPHSWAPPGQDMVVSSVTTELSAWTLESKHELHREMCRFLLCADTQLFGCSVSCNYRLYQLQFDTRVQGNCKCGDAFFYYFPVAYLSLTFCCHLHFLRSVFTTHLHLPTWRISPAGDIYIVSNLNISVCAYWNWQ